MSDELTPVEPEVITPETVSLEDYNKMIAERDALKTKNETLIGEKRGATQKAAEAEAKALEDAEAKAKRDGDYELLSQMAKDEKQKYEDLTSEFQAQKVQTKVSSVADGIGKELSKVVERAEALAGWAKEYISVDESGKEVYKVGGIEVGRAEVTKHLATKYAWAVDGVDSKGAGATGSGAVTPATNDQKIQDAIKNKDTRALFNIT